MSANNPNFSVYYDAEAVRSGVLSGQHREIVGGLWDEIGTLQFGFLKSQGMRPHHNLLDIGCGSLRGGVHFVRYLDAGNYYGVDLNQSLLDAGLELEIARAGLSAKLPRENLRCEGEFCFDAFGTSFDFALALSLFTHLPLNSIRLCLERLAPVMKPGGVFYASFFRLPEAAPTWLPRVHAPGGIRTFGARDPYHNRFSDFAFAARGLPWRVQDIGDFAHPRAQEMVAFKRVPEL